MDESTFEYMNLAPAEEHAALHGHAPSAAPYVKATTVRAREEAPLVKRSPSWGASFKHLVRCSYVNWLLVFLPISWALHFQNNYTDQIANADFATSLLALIPLARLLGYVAEDLSIRMNDSVGRMFCCTVGNSIELIIGILAVYYCDLRLAASSLVGSILSNALMVLGTVFLVGGVKWSEQGFTREAAQSNSSLLMIAVVSILIPAGYHTAFSGEALDVHEEGKSLLSMSRGIAVVLIGVYLGALAFQMYTHEHLYGSLDAREGREQRTRRAFGRQLLNPARSTGSYQGAFKLDGTDAEKQESSEEDVDVRPVVVPELNLWFAIVILLLLLGFLVMSSLFFVVQVQNVVLVNPYISGEWVGLIIIPICANFSEQLGSITSSVQDQLDEALNLALGKATQIALFIVPLLVLIAWAMGRPLSLLSNPFQSIVLFLAILVVNFTLSPGKTNWMSGFLLLGVWSVIAIAFWFYPEAYSPIEVELSCHATDATEAVAARFRF